MTTKIYVHECPHCLTAIRIIKDDGQDFSNNELCPVCSNNLFPKSDIKPIDQVIEIT